MATPNESKSTTHSCKIIITCLLSFASFTSGVIYLSKICKSGDKSCDKSQNDIYRVIGIAAFTLALCSCAFSYYSAIKQGPQSDGNKEPLIPPNKK